MGIRGREGEGEMSFVNQVLISNLENLEMK